MLMIERLKAARKEAGFTQERVAGLLGIDRSTYAYYELGNTNPSIENLQKLAALFKVDIGWLLGTDRPKNTFCAPEDRFTLKAKVKEKKIGELSPEERSIVGLYRIASKNGRSEELYEFLKKLSEDMS